MEKPTPGSGPSIVPAGVWPVAGGLAIHAAGAGLCAGVGPGLPYNEYLMAAAWSLWVWGGACVVLCPLPWMWRATLTVGTLWGCWLAITRVWWYVGNHDTAEDTFVVLAFFLVQTAIVFALARLGDWRLVRPEDRGDDQDRQIPLGGIFVTTAVVAVLLGFTRLIAPQLELMSVGQFVEGMRDFALLGFWRAILANLLLLPMLVLMLRRSSSPVVASCVIAMLVPVMFFVVQIGARSPEHLLRVLPQLACLFALPLALSAAAWGCFRLAGYELRWRFDGEEEPPTK